MNAFNDVNIAGACLVTSTEFAERLGISRDKWIFPLGGGRARDSDDCERVPKDVLNPQLLTFPSGRQSGTDRISTPALLLRRPWTCA